MAGQGEEGAEILQVKEHEHLDQKRLDLTSLRLVHVGGGW